MLKKIIGNYPVVILVLISLILCFLNYTPQTYLSGWDTLHPEFNFQEYFSRVIFGAWQEHQGLGALATQAHASELPRLIFYYLSSLVLPKMFLRYFYFFLCLLLGPLGVYFFLKKIFFTKNDITSKIVSSLGALFYLLNLITVQHFNVPLEMFATHYASIGWLYLFSIKFLKTGNKKTLLFFLLITLFSSSIAHTATLWYVYFVTLFLFLLTFSLLNKNRISLLKKSLLIVLLTVLVNSFWLMPNLYFAINHGTEVSQSKIHSLFTKEAFLQNASFGNVNDLFLLKNFLFNWSIYNNNHFEPLLNPWIANFNKPFIPFLGYLFFSFSIIGIIYSLWKKEKVAIALLPIFLICLFFWLNINPPFGKVFVFFQEKIPFFKEAFRFPFTKFSILLLFALSVYFSYCIHLLINVFKKVKLDKYLSHLLFFIVTISLIYYMLPAFNSNLINPKMRIKIPKEYFSMFDWFNNQPQGRIANFPINSFWGWTYHDWGYQGAGFLWFGLKQPLLDREFDRWSKNNEQYYREMTQAVYSQNSQLFKQVIEKYNIGYLLLDKSIIAPVSNEKDKVLFYDEIEKLILNDGNIEKVAQFGEKISVYKTNQIDNINGFLLSNASNIGPKAVFYEDFAYEKLGNYLTNKNYTSFPFRDFINNQNEVLIIPEIKNEGLTFQAKTDNLISFSSFENVENLISTSLSIKRVNSKLTITFYPNYPIEQEKSSSIPIVAEATITGKSSLVISVNKKDNFLIENIQENTPLLLGNVLLNTNKDNNLSIYSLDNVFKTSSQILNLSYSLFPCGNTSAKSTFGANITEDNNFSIFTKNSETCLTVPLSEIVKEIKNIDFNNEKSLMSVMFNLETKAQNEPSVCIAEAKSGNCVFFLSKNINVNNPLPVKSNQFLELEPNDLKNLLFKVYIDAREEEDYKIDINNLTFGFTKPSSVLKISKENISNALASNTLEQQNSYSFLVPFSGNQALSKDITKTPKTTGDCPSTNPRGENINKKDVLIEKNQDYIRYNSTNGAYCDHFSYENLAQTQAYLISITSRNIKGLPIRLCVTNSYSSRCDIYTQLTDSKEFEEQFFLLPPMGDKTGFDININNYAISNTQSINDLKSILVVPFPYEWLNSVYEGQVKNTNSSISALLLNKKINKSLYQIELFNENGFNNKTLVLPQSYEKGWTAYLVNDFSLFNNVLPFIFNKELNEHVLINNWANGWTLDDLELKEAKIIVVYWPQYLEYSGLIILLATFVLLLIKLDRKP